MNVVDWPKELAWIVDELEPCTIEERLETPMDSGPPKSRFLEALPGYEGIVEMTEDDLADLGELADHPFIRIRAPDTKANVIVRFYAAPSFDQIKITGGEGTTGQAKIRLVVNSAATKLEGS